MVSSVLRRLKLDPKFAKKKNSFLGVALPVLLSQNVSPKMGNGKGGVSGVEWSDGGNQKEIGGGTESQSLGQSAEHV